MKIEASKLQVLKDSLRWASWRCFTWSIIISITTFFHPWVELLPSRNYIWGKTIIMDQSKVSLSGKILINLQRNEECLILECVNFLVSLQLIYLTKVNQSKLFESIFCYFTFSLKINENVDSFIFKDSFFTVLWEYKVTDMQIE